MSQLDPGPGLPRHGHGIGSFFSFPWPRVTLWLWPLRDIYVGRCDRVLRLESLLGTPTATRHLALPPRRSFRDSAVRAIRSAVPFRPQSRKCMGMAKVSRRAGAHPDVQKDSRKPLLLLGCRVSANIRIIRFRDLHVHASPGRRRSKHGEGP